MKLKIFLLLIFACSLCAAQQQTASKTFTVTVAPAPTPTVSPLAIVTASLPAATQNVAYSASLVCSGGVPPYLWSMSGSLPSGLTLAAATGAINGTPTTQGTFSFTAICTDSSGSAPPGPPTPSSSPIVIAAGTPDGKVGVAYSFNFVLGWCPDGSCPMITGGTPPYVITLSSVTLPPGLTLHTSGLLDGTPTTAGSYSFSIQVKDATGQIAVSQRGIDVAP